MYGLLTMTALHDTQHNLGLEVNRVSSDMVVVVPTRSEEPTTPGWVRSK